MNGVEKKTNIIYVLVQLLLTVVSFVVIILAIKGEIGSNPNESSSSGEKLEISETTSGADDSVVKYGTYTIDLGGFYSREHLLSKYPKIKINSEVDDARLFVTIDFPSRFKEDYSSYTTSNGFKFALKYFFGAQGFDEEGGFYDVLWNNGCTNLINDSSRSLDGAIVGKDINGGHTWIVNITHSVQIAVDASLCKPGTQYRTTDTLGFLNQHIGKELYVGGYLSHVGKGANHPPIKGWEVSVIKSMKIEYTGKEGAISVVE